MLHSDDSILLVGIIHIHLIKYKNEYNIQIHVNALSNSNAKSLSIHPSFLPPPYPFPSKSRMDRRSSCHKFDKAAINLYLYHLR